MNLRTRLKRASLGALAALTVFGAGAFAQTSSPTVSVAVASGARLLSVTGGTIDGTTGLPTGPANLSFNGTTPTASPFGVTVTDVAHSRIGYEVDATLTNLYRLNPDAILTSDRFVCGDRIDSSAFTIGFATSSYQPQDQIKALVRSNLTFTDDVADDLGIASSPLTQLTVQVADWVGERSTTYVNDLGSSVTLTLMNVADGAGGTFTQRASHPCDPTAGLGATVATEVGLQAGTLPSSVDLSGLASYLYDQANTTTIDALTPAEAIAGDLLAPSSDQPGGVLYDNTKSALQAILNTLGLTVSDLDALTADVVADLLTTADPVLDLLGQTGVYANVPQLELAPGATTGKTTGLYQGTMTVTLTDK